LEAEVTEATRPGRLPLTLKHHHAASIKLNPQRQPHAASSPPPTRPPPVVPTLHCPLHRLRLSRSRLSQRRRTRECTSSTSPPPKSTAKCRPYRPPGTARGGGQLRPLGLPGCPSRHHSPPCRAQPPLPMDVSKGGRGEQPALPVGLCRGGQLQRRRGGEGWRKGRSG
jgi:hypothetical protein